MQFAEANCIRSPAHGWTSGPACLSDSLEHQARTHVLDRWKRLPEKNPFNWWVVNRDFPVLKNVVAGFEDRGCW